MSDDLSTYRKTASKLARSAEALSDALKRVEAAAKRLEDRPFAIAPAVVDARKALKPIESLGKGLSSLFEQLDALNEAGTSATERGRARLAAELHDHLAQQGLMLKGRLPTPSVGPLTLEFIFGVKPAVKIHYGPKVALLNTVSLDPEEVSKAVASEIHSLDGSPFDELAFLEELHVAWQVALVRLRLQPGERAPIRAVHEALASGRQPWQAWEAQGRGVIEYSAVRFCHDLTRLRTRRAGFGELALTVANREQTKSAAQHLWVDGTHYAFISFR